ncbi:MAG: hypothetical protein WA771_05135 [Chthoniobacterales bacterium]
MRPITKIFLLCVVAFVVYLLWPRSPDLATFNSRELAKLRVESWKQEQEGSGLSAVLNVFRTYANQYGLSPVASFRIAQSEVAAVKAMKQGSGIPGDDERGLVQLQEKYVLISQQLDRDFNTDGCARSELAWRMIEMEGGDLENVAKGMASVMGLLFDRDSKDMMGSAMLLAGSRAILAGAKLPAGYYDANRAAIELATDGYRELARTLASKSGSVAPGASGRAKADRPKAAKARAAAGSD